MNQIEKILNQALMGNVISVEELRQYSVLNLLMIIVERVNGVIENNNYLASEGLELEVVNQIKNMIDDGTLPNLLNQTMLAELVAKANRAESLVNDRPSFQKVNEMIAQAKLEAGTVETDGLIYKSDIESMLIYSVNKFDPSTMIKDKYLLNGGLEDYEGWNTTDYIRLDGSIISCQFYNEQENPVDNWVDFGWIEVHNIYYAFYDKDYHVVKHCGDTGAKMSEVEIPENAKYVRLSQRNTIVNDETTFMVITKPLTLNTKNDYMAYSVELKSSPYVTKNELEDIESMFIHSANKFNPSTVIKDQYLSYGVLTDYEGWNTTDYICLDGSIISCKFYNEESHPVVTSDEFGWVEVHNIYYAFYDKDYNVVQSSGDTGIKMSEVSIPQNAKYVRLSQRNTIVNDGTTFMIITEPLTLNTKNDYIPYSVELKGSPYVTKNEVENNLTKQVNALTVKSIARIGYDVYNSTTPPEHTIESYELAISKGFDEILCDLRSTKDSVPVCLHDETINATARNSDGTKINEPINILDLTYSEANAYDYGIRKGQQYKGTKLLKLEEVIKFAKRKGVTVHIETKCLTSETELKMLEKAVKIVKKYGMCKYVSWSSDSFRIGVLEKIISLDKKARVGTMPVSMTSDQIALLKGLQTGENRVFWFAWDTSQVSDETLNAMIENDVEMEIGTMNTEESILALMNDNRAYVTGVSSDKLVARLVLK